MVVGCRRQHRIDIRLARGSITEVDSAAYVLGMFRDVEPSGPANVMNSPFDEIILPAPIVPVPAARCIAEGPDPVYLIVRRDKESR